MDDVGFFEHLFSLFPDLNTYALILGGDLNCWLDPVLDRSSTNPSTVGRSARFIQAFLSNYGVCDVWRFLHPGNREYSCSSHVHHTYSRIDYFFIDNNLIPLVHSCIYQSIVISDHAPVVLTMSLPGLPQKIRQWQFNSTLLSDDSFVKFMEKEIAFFLTTNMSPDMSSLYVWDALNSGPALLSHSGQIVAYTAQMKQKSYKERADLAHQVREIDKHYAQTKCPDLYKKRLELKTKFDLLTTHSIEQSLLKSKTMFYIYGDKSDKLLANQLKGFAAKQNISKIQLPNGHITTDHSQINEAFRDFNIQLYTSESQADCSAISDFLNGLNMPRLSLDLKKRLGEPISQTEIASAISSMQSGQMSGP